MLRERAIATSPSSISSSSSISTTSLSSTKSSPKSFRLSSSPSSLSSPSLTPLSSLPASLSIALSGIWDFTTSSPSRESLNKSGHEGDREKEREREEGDESVEGFSPVEIRNYLAKYLFKIQI